MQGRALAAEGKGSLEGHPHARPLVQSVADGGSPPLDTPPPVAFLINLNVIDLHPEKPKVLLSGTELIALPSTLTFS